MPLRGVVQGSDGAFYGVRRRSGGAYGAGSVYRLVLQRQHRHARRPALVRALARRRLDAHGPARARQRRRPVRHGLAPAGFYNNGCIFRVPTTGGYSTIYSFVNTGDGGSPAGGLIQASDGRLYGTTSPANGAAATIFRLDLGLPLPAPVPQALLTNPPPRPAARC